MDRSPRKLPDALVRLLVVTAGLIVLGAFVVIVLIPESKKDVRVQWAADIQRERALAIKYAGAPVCAECHEEIAALKGRGYHRNLSCETCHGPARAHADRPEQVEPVIPETRAFCPRCHAYDPSRPRGFPMIDPVAHHPLKACATCHNPHDPKPPATPKNCSACHGETARRMAASRHVRLGCTDCHKVPSGHRVNPRAVRATRPQSREFCGKCHGESGRNRLAAEAPKVDMATHGAKYVCWQCHSPHSPEAGP